MILNTLHLRYFSSKVSNNHWETTTLFYHLRITLYTDLSQFFISSFHMPKDIYYHSPLSLLLEIGFL